jgi:uncharacterized Zn finger protein
MTSPTRTIFAAAAKWAASHPELEGRLARAVALTGGVRKVSPFTFHVEGTKAVYVVRVNPREKTSSCTCPDSHQGHHCKHRLAVALCFVSKTLEP